MASIARVLAALPFALLAAGAAGADEPPVPHPYAIGDAVADFSTKDLDGKAFSLAAARAVGPEKALAAVFAAARGVGVADPKPEDAIDALPSVAGDKGPDPEKRLSFVQGVGREFGLMPGVDKARELKTLGDVATWVEAAADRPIVLVCWRATCPTTHMYEDRILDLFGKATARLYVLATAPTESDAEIHALLKERRLSWRVLDDRKMEVTERLGGRRTPHWFVLDAKNVLRYSGALDNDARLDKPPQERIDYLARAIEKVAEGSLPEILMTEPVG